MKNLDLWLREYKRSKRRWSHRPWHVYCLTTYSRWIGRGGGIRESLIEFCSLSSNQIVRTSSASLNVARFCLRQTRHAMSATIFLSRLI